MSVSYFGGKLSILGLESLRGTGQNGLDNLDKEVAGNRVRPLVYDERVAQKTLSDPFDTYVLSFIAQMLARGSAAEQT
jgi:hypothetical protein